MTTTLRNTTEHTKIVPLFNLQNGKTDSVSVQPLSQASLDASHVVHSDYTRTGPVHIYHGDVRELSAPALPIVNIPGASLAAPTNS